MRLFVGAVLGAIAAWAAMVFWNIDPVDLLDGLPDWVGELLQ